MLRVISSHLKKINKDPSIIIIDLAILLLIYFLFLVFLTDIQLGLILLTIPIIGISWILVTTYRSAESNQLDWFKRFIDTRIGIIILILAGLIVLATIFFQTSPDSYWYSNFWER